MLLGLFGAAILSFGWWHLFVYKGKRFWSLGLASLLGSGGWFQGLQRASSVDAMLGTAFANAIVMALVGLSVGAAVDGWRYFRNRSLPAVDPENRSGSTATANRSIQSVTEAGPRGADHEVLGVSRDAGPEAITAAYQAMMQKHQKQPEPSYSSSPPSPPQQDQSRSVTGHRNKGILNIGLFLVVPIAVLIGVVWLGSKSGSGSSSSDTATQVSSPALDECYSLFETENYKEAITPCRQAAEQGDAWAQVKLSWMYYNGRGVPEDNVEAVKWLRKAAEQGEINAQTILGFMYDNGEGVEEDDTEAIMWYRKAASQGDATAKARLEELGAE